MTDVMVEKIKQNTDQVFFPFISEKGIEIDRVAFIIPGIGIEIYWYGLLIGIGVVLAMLLAYKKFQSFGIDSDRATDVIIGGVIGAVLFARLYYVIFSWSDYVLDGKIQWKQLLNYRDGGLAIYGGVIGGFLAASVICRLRKIKAAALFDIASMGFLIGQALGRWGNFFNQECYGSLTKLPWAMTSKKIMFELSTLYPDSPKAELLAHPTFLYESLWCIIGFLGLYFYMKHRKFDGEMFLLYLGWYGLGRTVFEGLRTDSLYLGSTSIRVSQIFAALCVIASVVLIVYKRMAIKKAGSYQFFYETELSKSQIEGSKKKFSEEKTNKRPLKELINSAFENDPEEDDDEDEADEFYDAGEDDDDEEDDIDE